MHKPDKKSQNQKTLIKISPQTEKGREIEKGKK